jgi:hypothetical protein
MTGSSVPSVSPESPSEIQGLIARAGLVLNPGQIADLVLAWRQVATLIAEMPRDRGFLDDMALTFRLPPPAPTTTEAPAETTAGPPPSRKRAAPKAAAAGMPGKRAKLRP